MRLSPTLTWIAVTYFALLLMSWGILIFTDPPVMPHKYQNIAAIENADTHSTSIDMDSAKISYYRINEGVTDSKPVVILHDNLYPAGTLITLAQKLNKYGREVIIPDQPGYGFTNIPGGFDFESKSKSVKLLLNHLELNEFHLVAHADGGPVAFYLTEQLGREPSSLVLLSASGVQEFKLLGDHTLNRSLHFLQFPAWWFADYLIPHFGWLYQTPFSYSTVRSAYAADFRPVRDLMLQFNNPVKIIHGKEDNYVSVTNAEEHYRILPQSELHLMDGDFRLYQSKPDSIAGLISNFLDKTAQNRALARGDATEERKQLSEEPFDADHTASLTGLSLILFLILLALTTLVSEDIACIGAGLLAAKGIIGFFPALAACFGGILLADVTIYWLGRWIGSPMLNWIPLRWFIDENDVRNAEQLFKESGLAIIFVSRFIPGTRFPTYFSAGMVRARFSLFLLYFLLAILIWTPLLVGLSMLIGQTLLDIFDIYQDYALWIFIGMILFILILVKYLMPLATQSGRRTFRARFERLKRKVY